VPYRVLHSPHQSKTDIKFWSIWRILVEGVGCLHHPPWGWYRADHSLPESREFDFSKLKWRRTKDQFRSGNKNLSSTRQAQGLDYYSVRCTVVWLRSSGWSAQSPGAVHGLQESLTARVGKRIYICMYIYMFIHICIYVFTHTHLLVNIYIYTWPCMCISIGI